MIETMPVFDLGPRESIQITITQQGDPARGILDYGILTTSTGCKFTGYIAAVKF
jgi:hypothetical protein